jgi:hypothetical protein
MAESECTSTARKVLENYGIEAVTSNRVDLFRATSRVFELLALLSVTEI